jgi:hypothetical protein
MMTYMPPPQQQQRDDDDGWAGVGVTFRRGVDTGMTKHFTTGLRVCFRFLDEGF